METLVINIPSNKSAFIKKLLLELGVLIEPNIKKNIYKIPNPLTVKTVEDAHNGKGISKPIKDINSFIDSL
jgi:hypothetical protein